MTDFNNILNTIFNLNSIKITDNQATLLERLYTALTETNKLYNLTAVTDIQGVVGLHFCDSLMSLPYIDEVQPKNLLDIGCGAGFPCLPIAITRGDISVHGMDSTAKKVDFSNNFAKDNDISNFLSVNGRAEELAQGEMRESFDFVTARAVARLNILAELALPFVKVGGYFLAMKGTKGSEELSEAENGINKLGARVVNVEEKSLILPNETQNRCFILIKKIKQTPPEYPRAYGKIKKSPLK